MPTLSLSGRAAFAKRSHTVQNVSGSLNAAMDTKMVSAAVEGSAGGGAGLQGAAENQTVSACLHQRQSQQRFGVVGHLHGNACGTHCACMRIPDSESIAANGTPCATSLILMWLSCTPGSMAGQDLMRDAALEDHEPIRQGCRQKRGLPRVVASTRVQFRLDGGRAPPGRGRVQAEVAALLRWVPIRIQIQDGCQGPAGAGVRAVSVAHCTAEAGRRSPSPSTLQLGKKNASAIRSCLQVRAPGLDTGSHHSALHHQETMTAGWMAFRPHRSRTTPALAWQGSSLYQNRQVLHAIAGRCMSSNDNRQK